MLHTLQKQAIDTINIDMNTHLDLLLPCQNTEQQEMMHHAIETSNTAYHCSNDIIYLCMQVCCLHTSCIKLP